jgi:hypothetical protein
MVVPREEMRSKQRSMSKNIRFFKDEHLISAPSAPLESGDSIAVTFNMQKNDLKHNTVIHGWTEDATL